MKLDENIISKISKQIGESKTLKAEKLYKEGKVHIRGLELAWDFRTATLYGAIVDIEVLEMYIRLELEGELFVYAHDCDCSLFSTKYCEHILAMLLEFQNNPKYINSIENSLEEEKLKKNNQIIDEIILNMNNKTEKIQAVEHKVGTMLENRVDVIPVLKADKYGDYMLSCKIGAEKMYKIKNMADFFFNHSNGNTVGYGTKLSVNHKTVEISKYSKKFFDFIMKYAESVYYSQSVLNNSYRYQHVKMPGGLLFEGKIVDEFFQIIKEGSQIVEFNGKDINIENFIENQKVDIEIKKGEENYSLRIEEKEKEYIKGDKNYYTIENNNILAYDRDKNENIFKILNSLKEYNKTEVTIEENKFIEFVNKVLPSISENVKYEDIEEKYIPKKLGVKVYLDVTKKGNILATIKWCYDDIEFYSNDTTAPNIVRNLLEEKRTIDKFTEDGFEYSNNYESYILKEEDKIYEFITSSINYYLENYEILISEEFKKREVRRPKISGVGVKLQNNLLNIDISGIEFDANELKNIMEQYILKKKYYRLKTGEFLTLEQNDDLDFIKNLAEGTNISYNDILSGEIHLPTSRSLFVDKLLEKTHNIQVEKDGGFNELIKNIDQPENNKEIVMPNELNAELRTYQEIGYKWLATLDNYKLGAILADDMGLGKTLQIIAIILAYKEQNKVGDVKPSIVVCPSSVTLNWKNEIEKFAPNLKTEVLKGTAKERANILDNIKKFDIVISSYDTLKRDIEEHMNRKIKYKYIVADEAQYIKNSNTQNAKSMKDLKGEMRYALTGTPIENSLAELWSIFDYIMPGYLFGYAKFKREFESPIIKEKDEEAMIRLKSMIEPFILRRTKKEVLTELPDKTIIVLKNEMEKEQEKVYLSYLAQTKLEIMEEINNNGYEKSQIKILSLLTRLRQICCHPSLFLENYAHDSSKLNQAIEIIEEGIASNHKILLFSSYTSMFEIIEEKLKERNIEYFKLTGSTCVDKRIEMVDEFNKNENIKIFLISLKAGGTGLNLTGADMVIHYDPWWNVSAENQATDRAYRIGQKNNVQVYKLITKNSIEEKINELQEKKLAMIETVLDTNQTFINKLSKEDIMNLFA